MKTEVKVIIVYFPEVVFSGQADFSEIMFFVRIVFGSKVFKFYHFLYNFCTLLWGQGTYFNGEDNLSADMTKQSIMLQLLTQIKREFNIGEPRFPHLKLKVSDISPKQDAIELYIRAKDILWNSNLPQRQVADIILDLGAAVQLKDGKNILQEIVKLFSLY